MPRKQHKDPDVEYILRALDAGMEKAHPNPQRIGCPNPSILKQLALHEVPVREIDRWIKHFSSCGPCLENISQLQEAQKSKRNKVLVLLGAASITIVAAASLLVMSTGGYTAFRHYYHPENTPGTQVASAQPVKSTVDLFNSGTLRGTNDEAMPLQEVSLPAAIVHLSVVLPRFSEVGGYRVNVSTDKTGSRVVASGTGNAVEEVTGKVSVNVTLDLRTAKPGAYFLATVRGTDNGTYYYPLRIN